MELKTLLASAVVSATVTAIIGPLIFFFLKRWDEGKKRSFEIRYAEYKHYLKALEQITASSRTDFERFMNEGYAECMRKILTEDNNGSSALLELNARTNELTKGVRESFTRATQELHGLRLVCSSTLLGLVNEFIETQRQLMDQSLAVLGNLKQIDLSNPNALFSGEMQTKGQRSQQLYDQIITQMRTELGIK